MRNKTLHDLLRAFTEEAALQLAHDTATGAEVPFEVVDLPAPGPRPPLYCYRPLTGAFIRERVGVLGRLPAYAPAARALESVPGTEDYLARRGEARIPGEPRERADAVLRAFLSAVFDESSEFVFEPSRFDAAWAELEIVAYEGRSVETVVAPLLGLGLASDEVPLGDGLMLVRGEALSDAPSEAVWVAGGDERPAVLAVLELEGDSGRSAVAIARARLRALLSALRLFEPGGFALGPVAWHRGDAGRWRVAPLEGSGRAAGTTAISPGQEDELRAFISLVARRRPRGGEVAWALRRFELGCERLAPFEALTDHLLALRALLEPEGPGSGRLAARLAAICALPADRPALTERVAHAISLERAVVAGLAPAEPGVDRLVDEMREHLRALLRDVLCGHLDSDLRGVADEIIAEAAEPVAPEAEEASEPVETSEAAGAPAS